MELIKKYKRIVVLFLLSNVIMLSHAVIAYPGFIDFKQPDGNIVKVKMKGDENLKWAESEDGYTLVYDTIGNLVYAGLDKNGDLTSTDIVATNIALRPVEVQKILQTTPKKLFYSESQRNLAKQIHKVRAKQMASSSSQYSVTGTRKMLLILVDYSDCEFQKTKNEFEKLVNQLNYTEGNRIGSVRDFYRENSFGQLDLVTDVVGVYRLKYNRAYYGANTANANDANPRAMAEEAIDMANADVNFQNYSGVHIIYAGYGEEAGGGGDCIWAHSWTVNKIVDGVRVSNYSCSPELRGNSDSLITNIGVICHEIGHVLGTADFYDTDYDTNGEYSGTGSWDLMAEGSWNGGGACPAHFNPYTKIYDFGWAEVNNVNSTSSHKLYAKSQSGYVRIDTKTSNEFFLLEYRAQKGFDRDLPGHGLMIYRACEGLSRRGSNTINASHKQQFYPVVANAKYSIPTNDPLSYGTIDSYTAPFPGNLGIDEITDTSIPSMKSWNGVDTELPITSIDEFASEGYVTFDVAAKFTFKEVTPKLGDAESLSIITFKFPKAATINTSVGNITLRSNSDSNNYGANISASMSDDGMTATITCTPSYSRWTVGQTYTLTIPAGYFVANSNNRAYEAISCSWTIVSETFTYCNVSPTLGELQEIKDILISFPNDIIMSNGGSFPVLNIVDENGNVVRTVATYKTKDINNNAALMATVSPSITALGKYMIAFPAGVLSNDSYGSMKNRAFDLVWDVVLPPVVLTDIKPIGTEVSDLSNITITFNEPVTINPLVGVIDQEKGEIDPETGEIMPIIEEISIISDDPGNYGKDFNVVISNNGLTATINCSPSYGSGWTVGKNYTLNIPAGYFVGASGGTNKKFVRSWTIVPERLFPTDITPAEGVIGSLSEIVISFPKTIYPNGSIKAVDIIDENGNVVITTNPQRSNNSIVVAINPPISEPGTYTFFLPAGQVSDNIRFNSGIQNGDIRLTWTVKSILANSISLDKTELNMQIDEVVTLVATVLPQTASNKSLRWVSSDETVAIVDQNGLVTAIGFGEAIISAMTTDGSNLFSTCRVNVKPIVAESLTLDKSDLTMRANETAELIASVLPVSAINKNVIWASSDETVATVDQNGLVTAIGIGVSTITATVEGTDIYDTCVVNVITTPGDANNDGLVTVSDIVATASYILGYEVPGFVPKSVDLNNDNRVNVTDITLLVNIVLNSSSQSSQTLFKAPQYDNGDNRLYIEDFTINAGETKQIAIKLDNADAFTAFQADIRLPDGIELCQDNNNDYMVALSDRKAGDHSLISLLRNDGAIRLLSYSLGLNNYYGSDGELVYLTVRAAENFVGTYQISIDNISFVESNREEHFFTSSTADVIGNIITGVANAEDNVVVTTSDDNIIVSNAPVGANVKLYEANGALIRSEKSAGEPIWVKAPTKGIYLIKVGKQTIKVVI